MRSEGNIHISNFKMMLCFAALYDMGTGKVKPLVRISGYFSGEHDPAWKTEQLRYSRTVNMLKI